MTGAIRFQCTFWIGGRVAPAHVCGETFGSLGELIGHYHARHAITRQGKREPQTEQRRAEREQ